MKQRIDVTGVSAAGAPYASAIAVSGATMIFTSGVLARDAESGAIAPRGDAEQQTQRCLDSIERILRAAGASLPHIVKMTVFLRRQADYEAMNRARRARLAGIDYASSTVLAGLVAEDALVEIECVAALPGRAAS